MSLSLASAQMIHRVTLKRNEAAADGYQSGKTTPADRQIIAEDEPCRVWIPAHVEIADGEKVAALETVRAIFRKDSPIKMGDRIEGGVRDRRGQTIIPGDLEVLPVSERTAPGMRFLSVTLRRIR